MTRSFVAGLVTVALLLTLLVAPAAVLVEPARGNTEFSGISIDMTRPQFGAKGNMVKATVVISGGPAGDLGGNYTCAATMQGENTTGGLVEPATQTNNKGVFTLNITLPKFAPQTITIVINGTSKAYPSGEARTSEATFQIKVVDPIFISARVYNTGSVDAKNVTARFYADGVLLNTQTFNVTAGSYTQLYYNWTSLSIPSGKHVVTVTVNDPADIIEFSNGNDVLSQTIYVGEQSNILGGVLTIVVIVMASFVALLWFSKPIKRKK